jgi:predicted O-methyltransferase YrrM
MSSHIRPTPLTDPLHDYVLSIGLREPDVLRRLREATASLPDGEWQTAPEQGPVLEMLLLLLNARRVLEVGTFTGYGTLWMALSLPPGGTVTTCDVSPDFPAVGRPFWEEARVHDRIDLRLGPAERTLEALLTESGPDSFDFAYIDADKETYLRYYEQCLALVRPGGIVAVDNTLWDGRPADLSNHEASTRAIRELNTRIFTDDRVDLCFLPFADGMTLARKRILPDL